MSHRTTSIGDSTYVAKFNALAAALDRRLQASVLVNGSMQVWQRGTSFTPTGGTLTPVADYWTAFRTVANYTISRQTGDGNSQFCARVQRSVGTTDTNVITFAQTLETADAIPLYNKIAVIRFKARAGAGYSAASGAMGVQVWPNLGGGANQSYFSFSGTTTPILSTTVTLTTSWQYFTLATTAVPTSAQNNGLGVLLQMTPTGVAGAADYFEVQEVSLTIGDANGDMGDFPFPVFADELRRCQRRYWKSFPQATAPAQNAGLTGAITFGCPIGGAVATIGPAVDLPIPMVRTPTLTFYNPAAANAFVRNTTGSTDATVTTSLNLGDNSFAITQTGLAGWAAGNTLAVHVAAEAELQ